MKDLSNLYGYLFTPAVAASSGSRSIQERVGLTAISHRQCTEVASVCRTNGASLTPNLSTWKRWVGAHLAHTAVLGLKLVPFVCRTDARNGNRLAYEVRCDLWGRQYDSNALRCFGPPRPS